MARLWNTALLLFLVAITLPARALVITPTYDMSVTSSPNVTAIETAFNNIVSFYDGFLTDPAAVTVTLTLATSGALGTNNSQQVDLSYSEYTQLLESHALTTGNQLALNALAMDPMGTRSPILGSQTVEVSTANARALGYNIAEPTDGDITININAKGCGSCVQFTRNGNTSVTGNGTVNSNQYDFISVAEHELNEVLGFGSALAASPSVIRPEDLFRYNQNSSTRSFTLLPSALAFLSINGGAGDLVQLNQDSNGDYGDFYSPGPGEMSVPCTPAFVQAAFTCTGQTADVSASSPEGKLLAAIGYSQGSGTPVITTWTVNCTAGTITGTGVATFSKTISSGPVLGALLGTPTSRPTTTSTPQPGDMIEIIGNCVEDVTIRTPNLMLTNYNGPDSALLLQASDPQAGSVQGQIEIAGVAGIVINGLVLGNNGTLFSFQSASDLALVYAHDGATVTVQNAFVTNGPDTGILAANSSQMSIFDSLVDGNALNNHDAATNGGIVATNGSKLIIGTLGGNPTVEMAVYRNGGDGISITNGSSLLVTGAEIACNLGRQVRLQSGSSGYLSGAATVVDAAAVVDPLQIGSASCSPAPTGNAVALLGASNLRIDQGASVTAISSTDAIQVADSSALLLQGSTITAPAAAATIFVDSNAVVALAGGNSICSGACSGTPTGIAFKINHVGSFIQIAPASFGYAAAQDVVFGSASLQLQSTADLGLGAVGGGASLAWTTGNGGVNVSQNSSFRLQGGVSITGSLILAQGSNAFFNAANGSLNPGSGIANAISSVTCPFTAIPAAHVSGPNQISPPITLSTNFFSTPAGQCLSF